MSKQSEIDRRWREYQNSDPDFVLQARTRKVIALQAGQKIRVGDHKRSIGFPSRGIQAYAVTLSTLVVLGSFLVVRYIANNRKLDQQDWDDWASHTESTGGWRRDS